MEITSEDLVKRIVQALVDHPEEVVVFEIKSANTVIIELKVAKEDIGKVIGKRGNTIGAIREIMRNTSGKARKRMVLELIEQGR